MFRISNVNTERVETRDTKRNNTSSYLQYYFNEYEYNCEGINTGKKSSCSIRSKELNDYIELCSIYGPCA